VKRLDRPGDAAHLHLDVGFGETAILSGGLDGRGGFDGLAKCLH
jgi:hypothetical protein